MRRNTLLLLLVGAVAALAVGCRDSIVAPARSSATPSSLLSFSKSAHGSDRTILQTVELSPTGGTYHVGEFDLTIPAGAVCDPATTKYGVGHWNDDCVPAGRSITVNLVAEKRGNHVSIDFQPDIRFRPAAGAVTLQTSAYRDLLTTDAVRQLPTTSPFFQSFIILYVPSGGASHIDEVRATGDRALVTHVDLSTGIIWRQIKHFSGYLITAGQKCSTPTPDATTCVVDDGSGGLGDGTTATAMAGVTIISTLSTDSTSTSASVVVTP